MTDIFVYVYLYICIYVVLFFFFSSRRRHTRLVRDWSSDVCSSDLADFVTTSDGTGVVHTAVMYGEDDYNLGMKEGLPAQHTVGIDGSFISGTHRLLDGRYVKDCDEDIIDLLSDENKLYREHIYTHDYPHCWRTDHPLLYYAMDSWFVRMTAVKEQIMLHNSEVEWAPD